MKITAIIVTYNRKDLLLRCLNAIQNQTYKPSYIYIIDNASTDGTECLVKNYSSIENIRYEKLDNNTGGAGGFYYGMKKAFEDEDIEGFWVMDDDGVPDKYCLEKMLMYIDEFAFISPMVLNIDNPNEMSFNTLKLHNYDDIKKAYPNGLIKGHANPFNGVLFRRDLVKKIGFPMKEMFIWGDENEYEARTRANGYIPVTVTDAIHFHPKDRLVLYPDFLGKKCIVYVESELKRYCKYRNFVYVLKKYKSWYNIALFVFRYSFFFVISRKFDSKGLFFFYRAVIDGIKNDFSKHKYFLGC